VIDEDYFMLFERSEAYPVFFLIDFGKTVEKMNLAGIKTIKIALF
jgi:hypothetical protein